MNISSIRQFTGNKSLVATILVEVGSRYMYVYIFIFIACKQEIEFHVAFVRVLGTVYRLPLTLWIY